MKNLVNEIVAHLKTLSYGQTVEVRSVYSKKPPVYPMVTVDEIDNATRMALKNEERLSNLGYQIDIYSGDMYPNAGTKVCWNIAAIVDAALNSQYGMTRTSAVTLPDVNDNTMSRITLRYSGILDVKTDYMYR